MVESLSQAKSTMKADRFVDLVAKWNREQKEAEKARDTTKFDFLNNAG